MLYKIQDTTIQQIHTVRAYPHHGWYVYENNTEMPSFVFCIYRVLNLQHTKERYNIHHDVLMQLFLVKLGT